MFDLYLFVYFISASILSVNARRNSINKQRFAERTRRIYVLSRPDLNAMFVAKIELKLTEKIVQKIKFFIIILAKAVSPLETFTNLLHIVCSQRSEANVCSQRSL